MNPTSMDSRKRKTRESEKTRIKKWFLVYNGPQKHISLPGIGRIIPGKEYPIDATRARQFRAVNPEKGWKVIGRILHID